VDVSYVLSDLLSENTKTALFAQTLEVHLCTVCISVRAKDSHFQPIVVINLLQLWTLLILFKGIWIQVNTLILTIYKRNGIILERKIYNSKKRSNEAVLKMSRISHYTSNLYDLLLVIQLQEKLNYDFKQFISFIGVTVSLCGTDIRFRTFCLSQAIILQRNRRKISQKLSCDSDFLLELMTKDCQAALLRWHNVINEHVVCCFVSPSIIPSCNGRINQHLVTFCAYKNTSTWNTITCM
jgi:hypothetical protein